MAFFSGLKAAYDSLGSEITKTFDSNVEQDSSTTAGDPDSAAILEVNSSPPPPTVAHEVTRQSTALDTRSVVISGIYIL